MIKSTAMLLEELKEYQDPFGKIKRLCREEKLFPLTKGLYETDPSVSGYLLAPVLFGPSYLSFEYALSFHGLIPETVHEYSSATCGKGKKKHYRNHFGDYSYQDVPTAAYPYGIRIEEENGRPYSIATPEKALCDKLYGLPPVKNLAELRNLLFDDLRIEPEDLAQLDAEAVTDLTDKYHSRNVRFLAKCLRRPR